MARYYVQRDGKWNIFSSVVDDFYFDEFLSFEDLKRWVEEDDRRTRERELETLLTDHPELNVMSYEAAIVAITIRKAGERWEGDDEEFDEVINKLHTEWARNDGDVLEFVVAVHKWLDDSEQNRRNNNESD